VPDGTGARTLTRLLPGADQDAFRRPLGTWPNTVMTNSALTMTRVLRSAGATLRVHLAPAGSAETWMLQETVLATEGRASTETVMGYVGVPVRMRLLLGTDLDEEIFSLSASTRCSLSMGARRSTRLGAFVAAVLLAAAVTLW